MPRQDFGPGRTEQHDPIVFGLFGRDWTCVHLGDAAPGITRIAAAGQLPQWRRTFEILVGVSELVVDSEAFGIELTVNPPEPATIVAIAAWLSEEYGRQAGRQVAAAPPSMRDAIEAELGPQDWNAKNPDAIWSAILDVGGEVA